MKRFNIKWITALTVFALAGCGEVEGPFNQPKPYTPSVVPADFAIVVDETNDSYYSRQDIRQVITASDLMSKTAWTTRRDYNNTIAQQYASDHPLNAGQLQAMWNEVCKYDLMSSGKIWYYWETNTDNYHRNERSFQIRANGKLVSFKLLNHWGFKLRDLALLVEAVRFPVTGGDGTATVAPVVAAASQPATAAAPAETMPAATAPATQP